MYHREPREPTPRDMMLVELVTQTAALVIDREQAKATLDEMLALHSRAPERPPMEVPSVQ
jgi:GAF domain-containing protein